MTKIKRGTNIDFNKNQFTQALEDLEPFELERDVFFVHGWGDESNVCWTEPYTEMGDERDKNWAYTIKEWIEDKGKITNACEKVHYIKLMEDEKNAIIKRDKYGRVESVDITKDSTSNYENFFQFAELLKEKIDKIRQTDEIDIVCHSMGGLDAVTAIAVDADDDNADFIKSPYLKDVNMLITVSTPHRGSPFAFLSDKKIVEIVMGFSKNISKQGVAMSPNSEFIKKLNEPKIKNTLLSRIKHLYMYGGGSDEVVPSPCYMIDRRNLSHDNYELNKPFFELRHSKRMGITQKPIMILEIMKLLQK